MRRVGPEGRARPGASKVDVEMPACVEFGTRSPRTRTDYHSISPLALHWQTAPARPASARFIGAASTNTLINQPDHHPSIWHQSPVPSHLPYYKHFGNNPVTVVQPSSGYPLYPLILIQMLNDLPSAPQVPFLFGS